MRDEIALLLVDDDDLIRTMAARGLSKAGFQLTEVNSGEAALSWLASNRPDLVLLDVHMPGISGFEVLSAIRGAADLADLPVIILTGDDDDQAIRVAFEREATDFMTKPLNLRLLINRIDYALASHAREHRLRVMQAEQASACNMAKIGFWRISRTELPLGLRWSSESLELLGLPHGQLEDLERFCQRAHPDDRDRVRQYFKAAVERGESFEIEARFVEPAPERVIRFNTAGNPQQDNLIGAFQDVTALRRFEDQALYLADHDRLTGLINQSLFMSLLDKMLAEPDQQPVFVAVISAEHWLASMELLGHQYVEESLVSLAGRLQSSGLPMALTARLDDGLFAIAVPLISDEASLAGQLQTRLSEPLRIGDKNLAFDALVGSALASHELNDANKLLGGARLACRSTSRSAPVQHYASISHDQKRQRLMLDTALRNALADHQFSLVFQPQIDVRNGQVHGVEALLRWTHPDQGPVSPAVFIPLLEENGLIEGVGAWVIDQAIAVAAQLQSQGFALCMGINLSIQQLQSGAFIQTALQACRRHALDPGMVDFEITEGMAIQDPQEALSRLGQLKDAGFRISLDDFGTGYSSLAYITRLPIDTVKIDRSFVTAIDQDPKKQAITSAIAVLCQRLDLAVIAEGVEMPGETDYLVSQGIHYLQGFLYSRPLDLESLCTYLAQAAQTLPNQDLLS